MDEERKRATKLKGEREKSETMTKKEKRTKRREKQSIRK